MLTKPSPRRLAAAVALPLLALVVAAPEAAHAQGYTPIYAQDFGNPATPVDDGVTLQSRTRAVRGAIAYLPATSFLQSGALTSLGSGGTRTINGGLFAADVTFAPGTKSPIFDLGAWYFQEGGNPFRRSSTRSNLYEFHARIFAPRREIGLQAGILKSNQAGFRDDEQYTVFAVTEYGSYKLRRRARPSWGFQFGAGLFIDPNFDPAVGRKRTTVNGTFFLSASIGLGGRFSALLSQWYVRNRTEDTNRLAFGFGYSL